MFLFTNKFIYGFTVCFFVLYIVAWVCANPESEAVPEEVNPGIETEGNENSEPNETNVEGPNSNQTEPKNFEMGIGAETEANQSSEPNQTETNNSEKPQRNEKEKWAKHRRQNEKSIEQAYGDDANEHNKREANQSSKLNETKVDVAGRNSNQTEKLEEYRRKQFEKKWAKQRTQYEEAIEKAYEDEAQHDHKKNSSFQLKSWSVYVYGLLMLSVFISTSGI